MNIKSLLLGSAAALVAVSGARAADAVVVAEPEPVEYVRVCDAYGAGYFYIPGTETCLRISGYLRYDMGAGDALGAQGLDRKDFRDDGDVNYNDTWRKRMRFTLRTHTASETELGTLRTYTETRFQWDTNNDNDSFVDADGNDFGYGAFASNDAVTLNFAYIELGGLRIGKDETAFRTFLGYAGNVINDDVIEPEGYDTTLISYTFTGGNGFSAIVSAEQGADEYTIDSYTPHIVGGLKWAQGWGSIGAVIGYDANYEEYAVKGRIDVNITDAFEVFVMGAWQSDGDYANFRDNFYASWGGDWAGWVGASYKFTDKATFNAQVSFDDSEQLAVAANVAYELVPGFTITPEVLYVKESEDLTGSDDDVWGGMIRFQRSF
ncbi:porin [Phyllobacterium salinisoli]|uniref:Porin n=1 Tax=Phyllobacterium salinisoli TaxID=1899321 RepID=A0A368K1H5_9HYPH|nr:porin [Phyllobacterium salinisoli]RCS23246.1 porin [Phyllobacterium salinisoli]